MLHLFRVPLLHTGVDPTGWLWSDWRIEPTIAIGLLGLVAGYLWLTRHRPSSPLPAHPHPLAPSPAAVGEGERLLPDAAPLAHRDGRGAGGEGSWGEGSRREDIPGREEPTPAQKAAFLGGALTLFVALGPPLDDWSDHYLLSAHMVQHLLLIMLAAPLLLYGTPGWILAPLTRNRVTNAIGYGLTRPVVAFALANAVLVVWHLPLLYDAALRSQPIHIVEHMTMLGTALLAWWPIVGPLPQWPRLPLALHSVYFFAMTLPGSVVGAFITFAQPGLYAPYDTARRIFGIDLATDQQAAGLLMWVVVSAIYLLLLTISFFRWVQREEAADAAEHAAARPPAAPGTPPGEQRGARAAG